MGEIHRENDRTDSRQAGHRGGRLPHNVPAAVPDCRISHIGSLTGQPETGL
jgi:hypothetical protein